MSGQHIEGFVQLTEDLLGLHHGLAALGERRLLTSLRRKLAKLIGRVAQKIRLAARRLDAGAVQAESALRLSEAAVQRRHGGRLALQAAEGVENVAMRGRIDQRPVVVLAVDLDQRAS